MEPANKRLGLGHAVFALAKVGHETRVCPANLLAAGTAEVSFGSHRGSRASGINEVEQLTSGA